MPEETAAKQFRTTGRHYALAVFSSIAATALRGSLDPVLADAYPFIFSFGAVAITAATGGWRPGAVATILSYLLDDWFFTAPRGSLALLTSPAAAIAFSSFCFTCV